MNGAHVEFHKVPPFGPLSPGVLQTLPLAMGNELAVLTPLKSHHSSIFAGTWLVFPSLSNPFPCQNVPKRPRVKTSSNVPVSKRPQTSPISSHEGRPHLPLRGSSSSQDPVKSPAQPTALGPPHKTNAVAKKRALSTQLSHHHLLG